MKLFKSLLVAPATLGLLAPFAATANEVTINDFNAAEEIAVTNSRIDGLEARLNNFEAGSFSETTTASFSTDFAIGSVDGLGATTALPDGNQTLQAVYGFQIDLNTSFTGEDSLDIAIDAGNADAPGVVEFDGDTTANEALVVDEITYTFPLGEKTTVMIGDNADASSLFTTACVYGGPSNTLDACGNVNANVDNGGVMAGAAYDFGNGLTASVGWAGDENDVANEEGVDAYGVNFAYTGDNYGVSATYAVTEDGAPVLDNMEFDSFLALNAFYTPDSEGLPSISVGYEAGEDGSVVGNNDGLSNFFVGLTWPEVGPGEFGVAMGTRIDTVEDTDAQYMYEAYYSYPINDGMTITPLVFAKDVSAANTDDMTGVMVKTSFSF